MVTQDGNAVAELGPLGGAQSGASQPGVVSLEALAEVGLLEPPGNPARGQSARSQPAGTVPATSGKTGTATREQPVAAQVQLPVGVSVAAALAEVRGTRSRPIATQPVRSRPAATRPVAARSAAARSAAARSAATRRAAQR